MRGDFSGSDAALPLPDAGLGAAVIVAVAVNGDGRRRTVAGLAIGAGDGSSRYG
jgi:hypothetical protein